jgi:hypothetical protein
MSSLIESSLIADYTTPTHVVSSSASSSVSVTPESSQELRTEQLREMTAATAMGTLCIVDNGQKEEIYQSARFT